jgi:hypothetical protein
MATGRHRHYDLRDEDDVAQLDADYRRVHRECSLPTHTPPPPHTNLTLCLSRYRRVLHGCRPDKLEVQDRHIQRHKDSAHVDRITSAYRKIDGCLLLSIFL